MQAIKYDPDIRDGLFRLDEPLTLQQVRFLAGTLRDLIRRHEASSRDERARPIDWPEWHAFIDAAYACGFVCGDAGEDMGDDCTNWPRLSSLTRLSSIFSIASHAAKWRALSV